LFIICGIYIHHLYITIVDVREAQRQRSIEFEARRAIAWTAAAPEDTEFSSPAELEDLLQFIAYRYRRLTEIEIANALPLYDY